MLFFFGKFIKKNITSWNIFHILFLELLKSPKSSQCNWNSQINKASSPMHCQVPGRLIILYYTKGFLPSYFSVTLRVPPLDSEMGWTGELWSKTYLLNWQKEDNRFFLAVQKIFLKFSDVLREKSDFWDSGIFW